MHFLQTYFLIKRSHSFSWVHGCCCLLSLLGRLNNYRALGFCTLSLHCFGLSVSWPQQTSLNLTVCTKGELRTFTHRHTQIHIHILFHKDLYIHTHIHTHTLYTHTYIHITHSDTHKHTYTPIYAHTYITNSHTYTQTHRYTHTHLC